MVQQFVVIAHNIRSLYNVGSIFRTADAFGLSKIYLTGYTGAPINLVLKKRIAKTALGAEEFVPWEYKKSVSTLIKKLKLNGYKVVALENHVESKKLPIGRFKKPVALLLGEETKGITAGLLKQCDEVLEIPMLGKKESLNVSVAFGIAAFALTRTKIYS